mgnify:CR=1 FL=1
MQKYIQRLGTLYILYHNFKDKQLADMKIMAVLRQNQLISTMEMFSGAIWVSLRIMSLI